MSAESAPGLAEILRQWDPDILWLGLGALSLWWFWRAVRRSSAAAKPHPRRKQVAFTAGVALVLLAAISPVEEYGNTLLWVNFTSFLLLTMVAAPLLLLGAPITLAFRSSGPQGRTRLRRVLRSRITRAVTFPVFTWLLFAVVTYLWQFSDLAEVAAGSWAVREVQLLTLLAVSLLFWAPALAIDPLPARLGYPFRILYVLVEMVHKGLFGGMFLSMRSTFHEDFTAPWGPSALTDQRMAILVLWVGGNLLFVVALGWLVAGWLAYEQRNQRRVDFRLARQREAERLRRVALAQVFERPV